MMIYEDRVAVLSHYREYLSMEDVVRSVNTEQGKDKVEVVFGNKKK